MRKNVGLMVLVALIAAGAAATDLRAGQAAPAGQAAQAARSAAPQTPACGPSLPAEIKNVAKDSRCFELRTYTVREGSSIDVLHSRFRDHTNALFKKHGMTVVGYWQPVTKPNVLIYMLAYKDGAARDAAWAAFNIDPEWVKARTELQVGVQVENVFMSATDYAPLK